MYTLDHLATFSCGQNQSLHHPLDAINKLRVLEKSSGIWIQRMKIRLDKKDLHICSFDDGSTTEKFSLNKIHEPTAVVTDDPMEVYNNILMFTVPLADGSKKKINTLSEIHLFQCLSVSAQEIVDEINRLKSGSKSKKTPKSYYVPPQFGSTFNSAGGPFMQHPANIGGAFGASKSLMNIHEYYGNNSNLNHSNTNAAFTPIVSPVTPQYAPHYLNGNGSLIAPNGSPYSMNNHSLQQHTSMQYIPINNHSHHRAYNNSNANSPLSHTPAMYTNHNNVVNDRHNTSFMSEKQAHYIQEEDTDSKGNLRCRTTTQEPRLSIHNYAYRKAALNHTNNNQLSSRSYNDLHNIQNQQNVHATNYNSHNFNNKSNPNPPLSPASFSMISASTNKKFPNNQHPNSNNYNGHNSLKSTDYRSNNGNNFSHFAPDDGTESIISQQTEHDVLMLNHCFDDIENFVSKIQHSSAALRELEKRKAMSKKNPKIMAGSGMLSLRAKPPNEAEFIDILQKFKLAFNLLARLKNCIRDPSAPELVHFLIRPLEMIVVYLKQHNNGSSELTQHIVTPLLTTKAIDLLNECLTNKEVTFWKTLGEAWNFAQDHFHGYAQNFSPVFNDGWQARYQSSEIDKMSETSNGLIRPSTGRLPHHPTNGQKSPSLTNNSNSQRQLLRSSPASPLSMEQDSGFIASSNQTTNNNNTETKNQFNNNINNGPAYQTVNKTRSPLPPIPTSSNSNSATTKSTKPFNNKFVEKCDFQRTTDDKSNDESNLSSNTNSFYYHNNDGNGAYSDIQSTPSVPNQNAGGQHFMRSNVLDQKAEFCEYLRETRSKAYEVMFDRESKNPKELTVSKGEILQILDDNRNWWKARNYLNEIGYVPYTILRPYSFFDA